MYESLRERERVERELVKVWAVDKKTRRTFVKIYLITNKQVLKIIVQFMHA